MSRKETNLLYGLISDMVAVLLACLAPWLGSIFIIIAIMLIGLGFWCFYDACMYKPVRVKVRCRVGSNAVEFCQNFAKQIEAEREAERAADERAFWKSKRA